MYMLTVVSETYSRTASGKSWRAQPDETSTETFPWDRRDADGKRHGEDVHRSITEEDTLAFFRRLGGSERGERAYTPVGYIVTRQTSTNPDRTIRRVRKFRITDV